MRWSSVWPLRWLGAKRAPARKAPSAAKLAVEILEDRLVPSTLIYDQWRQQTFKVDDVKVGTVATPVAPTVNAVATPQNGSFGSMIGLPAVFGNYPYRGDGYSVAIIDTGIDYKNANLGGGFGAGYRVIAGWDFVNNDADPMDDNGHGTHVAGIIGSSSATYSGVAPNVNLIALKVLDKSGSGSYGSVESALQWVVANQAKYHIVAVNMSLGSGNYTANPYTFLDDELSSLKNKGVFLSVAAGNSFYGNNSKPGLDYPAIDPYVVSVGAVYDGNFGSVAWGSGARDYSTAVDRVASFSQRSSALSIMAPGAMITSTYLNNTMQSMAGTSMAAPVVAGAAVILHQAMDARGLTANETAILSAMQKSGVTVVDGDDENDNVTNTGLSFKRLDLAAALDSLGKPTNSAPILQTIANQTMAPGSTRIVTLNASDPDGNAITYTASIVSASASQALQLKQQLGLTYAGSYFTNTWGKNEKWLSSTTGWWYCILPNGELHRWTGAITSTLLPANLVATLATSFYADPSLLWNAQPATAPTLSISGNQLTIRASSSVAVGTYQVQVKASDGALSATKTFTLTVQANTAPQITTTASTSLQANRSQTISIGATDAQNDPISYKATIVGTFAKRPATLVLSGNRLTVNSSPDYTGSFDVRVSASDGRLSSTATIHVSVTSAPGTRRFHGDVNGDGIQDTIFFNADGSWWVSTPKADGSFVNQRWAQWSAASNWSYIQVGDINGDGKLDIVGRYVTGQWFVGYATGTGFVTKSWTGAGTPITHG